jgi:hypothetical protein
LRARTRGKSEGQSGPEEDRSAVKIPGEPCQGV